MNVDDPVIIGAGPGGLAAAMQLKRYGISAVVIEKDSIGGLLKNANLVENYPGFPGGIPGMRLVQLINKQALEYGIQVRCEEVTAADYQGGIFSVEAEEHIYRSTTLVVASGTKPRQFDELEIPETLKDRVYYEVHPLLQETGKRIAIVGAGDAAFDYALNLGKRNDVLILNRGERLRCLKLLWERAQANPRIQYRENMAIKEITPGASGDLCLRCDSRTGMKNYSVDYLVGAIGRDPQLEFLSDRIRAERNELGNEGRLYFVGDVTKGIYRQTAIAIGEGIMTAMKIFWRKEESEK